MAKTFFISDTHFGHARILSLCNRPFVDAAEMDWTIVRNWNEVVGDNDIVYHLGDFTLGNHKIAKEYFGQLNGRIRVLGLPWHHDKRWIKHALIEGWTSASDKLVEIIPPIVVLEFLEYGDGTHPKSVTLSHYPLAEWDRMFYGGWHLHGHTHGNYTTTQERIMDVGVDCIGFTPISIEQVAERMNK